MARRLPQTLADYLVIAISPALIMALVGSLMFFLLRVFYQGDFQERLHWVMVCFVFAAVLIARISIEQGFERAAPFGAALALLVGIAANEFMEYRGAWVDDYSWIINFGIIGLVWWCIHQLTWDCTVIDEDQDASGEGLMQVVGLERPADARNESDPTAAPEEIEGTTSREVPASFWQRHFRHQRRPHTPGVWVVYFSLAALPIFGIGQWFIPASDVGGRRYVFWLLGVYVASGLALLVTTSFLGLRRYLRQRRIEMPTAMANLWLATGGAIIAVLLVAAALLPRPSAEYAISQLPFTVGSPEQEASDAAPLERNGTEDDDDSKARGEADPNADPNEQPTAEGKGSEQGGEGSGEKSGGDGKSSDSKGGGSQDKSAKASAQGSEQQQQDGGKSQPNQQSQAKGDAAKQSENESQSKQQGQKQPDKSKQSQPSSGKNPLENMKKFRELERELAAKYEDKPEREAEQQAQQEEPAESPEIPPLQPPLGPLATILQYVFYAVVILGTLFAAWYYRREIMAAIRSFLKELAEWWRSLWGGKRIAAVEADGPLAIRVPPPAFASFADPFASGTAGRMSAEELVRYSFSAFEAWSGEHGCPHEPDQTPHELVREVSRLNAHISADARNLAELYARAAFAKGQLPASTPDQLEALWRQMTRSLRVRV